MSLQPSVVPKYFDQLGRCVSTEWSRHGRSLSSLPEASETALHKVDVPPTVTCQSILLHAAACQNLPPQSSRTDTFGQPPLILYHGDDFYIQALVWMEGSTAVHDHKFSGAFRVLEGTSLHIRHAFRHGEMVLDDRILLGRLSQETPEVLRPSDIRRIEPGYDLVHGLFHLEMPTVTIVVRNDDSHLGRPQYNYMRSGIAYDALSTDRRWTKRMMSIDSLLRLDLDAAWDVSRDIVHRGEIWDGFQLLLRLIARRGWDEPCGELTDIFTRRVPALKGWLQLGLTDQDQIRRVLLRRAMLRDVHHRVFLALLANLPDPRATAEVVHQLYPDRPASEVLLDWAEELSNPALKGVSGLRMSPERITELRANPATGRDAELLAEIRKSWGDPTAETLGQLYR